MLPPRRGQTGYSVTTPTLIDQLALASPNHSPEPWNGRSGLVVAPDGLPAREVKAHNRDKAHVIEGYSGIFTRAMKKWKYRCYLDLYCGPGVCWVKDTGRFVLGSPLIALNVDPSFTHLVFNDLDGACTDALQARMSGAGADVTVLTADANDPATINSARKAIPAWNALSLALLDPQGMDLNLDTIRDLSQGKPMDLLINLPIHNLWRCLRKGDFAVLNRVLGSGWPPETTANDWKPAARDHFHSKLDALGYDKHEGKQIFSTEKNSPLYDFILYSRVALAMKFFKAATRTDAAGNEPFPMFAN